MTLSTEPSTLPTRTAALGPKRSGRGNHGLIHTSNLWAKLKSITEKLQDGLLEVQIPERIKRHLTFYRLHLAYFLVLVIMGASFLYGAHRFEPKGMRRFSLVDAFFNTVSIVTVTGITSVRVADFSASDRALILILMTLGSPVFTSLLPLYVRRFYFFRHHRAYVKDFLKDIDANQQRELPLKDDDQKLHMKCSGVQDDDCSISLGNRWHSDDNDIMMAHLRTLSHAPTDSDRLVNIGYQHQLHKSKPVPVGTIHHVPHELRRAELPCFPVHQKEFPQAELPGSDLSDTRACRVSVHDHKVSRSDQIGLCSACKSGHKTETQLPKSVSTNATSHPKAAASSPFIRTMEHRGLVTLCWLIPLYMVGTQLASILLSLAIIYTNKNILMILKKSDVNPAFFSLATTVAAFTNSGVPSEDDNMVPFRSQHHLLMLYTVVSLMGNLLYPPCIRFIIWIFHRCAGESRKPVYGYLLDHPRRCFTHLFPPKQSVWLCLTVFGFTAVQLVFFCALDWHSEALKGLDPLSKVVDGVYQSVSVRNSGGAVVAISELSPPMLVLYVFMMFIAVYPVALLRQNSTEYEQADLGIYKERWNEELTDNSLKFQSRKLLARDSVYLCTVLFIICLLEKRKIGDDPLNYSIFNIIFEVVSAYGGVGMSMGYSCALQLNKGNESLKPCVDVPYSFSGKWSSTGQIVLAITMLIGRHRGLPYDIDSAIKLPFFNDLPLPSTRVSDADPHLVQLSQPSPSPKPPGIDNLDHGKNQSDVNRIWTLPQSEERTELETPQDDSHGRISQRAT